MHIDFIGIIEANLLNAGAIRASVKRPFVLFSISGNFLLETGVYMRRSARHGRPLFISPWLAYPFSPQTRLWLAIDDNDALIFHPATGCGPGRAHRQDIPKGFQPLPHDSGGPRPGVPAQSNLRCRTPEGLAPLFPKRAQPVQRGRDLSRGSMSNPQEL